MAERVFVTGGRGFLGRRIVEALERMGYEVVSPCRPEYDLMDRPSVDAVLKRYRPELVVHSAAYYGGLGICQTEPADAFYLNVIMSANIIDAAARHGVRRFLAVGSSCAYPGLLHDLREEDFWAGPLHPSVEAYGFTKKLQQVGLNACRRQFGMEGQLALVTNLYGEGDVFTERRAHVVAALIKKFTDAVLNGSSEVVCWGTGRPIRELLYVGDAAEGIARLLQVGYTEPVNIGTGIGTSIRELAELIARLTGFTGRIVWDESRPDGVMRKVMDISRMKQVLNWQPPTSLAEGLERTLRWYWPNKAEADARP